MVLIGVLLFCVVLMMHNCCAIALGSDKFEEIRQSPDFVDKTLLIKEFFNSKRYLVIAAPDGFGKSTNLHMIRSFLTADINRTCGGDLFRDTDISKDEYFMKNELGNHAVLYCSFKQKEDVVDYKSMVSAFRSILHRTFSLYPYLTKSKKLSRFDKKELYCYTGVKKHLKLKYSQILVGLHFLSKLLKKHHEREVVLMIDDYDRIILDSLFTNDLECEMVLGFHNAIFSGVLHDNKNINKTIFAGTTCTCMKPFKQLQYLQCVGFLEDKRFAKFFGITESEMDQLLNKEVFKNVRDQKQEIKKWYDGYVSSDLNTHVYNTRSTLSFLSTRELKSYWTGTRTIKTLKHLLIEPVVQQLLNESMDYKTKDIYDFDKIELVHMKGLKTFAQHELWNEEFADLFIRLLMEKGYFTLAKEWIRDSNINKLTIKIPNEEIHRVLEQVISSFFDDSTELLDRLKQAVHEASFTDK